MAINPLTPPQPQPGTPKVENTVQTALAAGQRIAAVAKESPLGAEGKPYIVLQDGPDRQRVEFVDQRFERPARADGSVPMDDSDSFLSYWKDHAGSDSRIFAKMDPVSFVAVLNENAGASEEAEFRPNWRDHRINFTPKHSREWATWMQANGKQFDGNVAFAEWLEDQLPDIVDPDGSAMMQIALNFRVQEGVQWGSAARLADGNVDLNYRRVVEGSAQGGAGKVTIPEQFAIKIPVFAGVGQPVYQIEARFRYRLLQGGALKIWYTLIRPHKVLELAFTDLWTRIEAVTDRKLLLGAPE